MRINIRDKNRIKTFFNNRGYVLNFNDSTFDSFTVQSIGIPVQSEYKLSKGKSLEEFIDNGTDSQVRTLTKDLLEYYEDLPELAKWGIDRNDVQVNVIRNIVGQYFNSNVAKFYSEIKEYNRAELLCSEGIEIGKPENIISHLEKMHYEKAFNLAKQNKLKGAKDNYLSAYVLAKIKNNLPIIKTIKKDMEDFKIGLDFEIE
ncbi:hypothetical protein CYV26_06465 [Carnobacterium maltaromaticum]|uniref:hypothetical protein n=1 Tax=Carnobacterium maltaromaticum TaxID=2751 RepID=UPI000C7589E4|nr:hypothetical protein [Carnobacterium maltaromaticum]PLS38348.1 hypothetical protein CYV33_03930 [Carnobacterium maltaromaticum]PLS38725.1 hypothetical protein CYV31_06455 [Carnobacterium maltaromaticum]PLS39102.1 hypothetical protein CYV30_03925 [Carnobacterium maltaromaticum]PLS45372.1 hypothetical protein CYV28_03925 [Carnobacterium maltaromaticum]PLS48228.1 hypothetical protein CYV27_01965 [Carnobacterium maltaromaticum]